jgi:uncharacterized protein YcnI
MRAALATIVTVLISTTALLAHVGVTPNTSKPGAIETYTLRVPSEGGRTTTAVRLEVPQGVTVLSVSAPQGAAHEEKRVADRVTAVTWTITIAAGARAELSFTARNPPSGDPIVWRVHQSYSDGTTSAWIGPAGDRAPAPVTKLAAAPADD